MSLELRKDARYALVVPTSMGVRITPVNAQPVHVSKMFEMQATVPKPMWQALAPIWGSR